MLSIKIAFHFQEEDKNGDSEKTNGNTVAKAYGFCADHGALWSGNIIYRADPFVSGGDRGIFRG